LLLSYQNPDGGFGGYRKLRSNIVDSVFAMRALKSINYHDSSVIEKIIQFVINNQNSDGGWGFKQETDSKGYYTAIVLLTLQQFQRTTSIATAINKATGYLISQQQTDGSWGTVYETSLAYLALVGETTDATVLGNAINHITTTQLPNGSWDDDPYSTALALRALHVAVNPPPQPTTGTVTGKVVDTSTNQPLNGVSVSVVSIQPSATTTTDTTGNFTLPDIPAGSQTLTFALSGYATSTIIVNITAGSITDIGTVTLSSSQTTGIIKGTV
jgi:hypothetical protein